MKKDKPYDKTVYRSLTMITQFGINMIVPIVFMSAFGIYLDKKLGTVWITVVLFFVGAIAGGQNVYRMAKRIYEMEDKEDRRHRKITANKESERENEVDGNPEKKKQNDF